VPQVPSLSGKTVVDVVFSDTGVLARVLEAYEPRDGQRRMAAAVAAIIEEGGLLLAEAGTGTGKTLAYLAPAILSGRRVLVSTGTKNLQEQIYFKDLPLLQSALGIRFTATLMKGRSNYACLQRWDAYKDAVEGNARTSGRLIDTGDRIFLPILDRWLATTETGDRAELRDLPEDLPGWKEIAAEAESCLGVECPQYDNCFVTRMRRRAAESDVVIVNHHLLCADASVRQSAYGEVIPACSTLVVDEAHQLEEVATQYFGFSVSPYRVEDLVRDAQRLVHHLREPGELTRSLARVADHSRAFFNGLALDPSLKTSMTTEARLRYTAEGLSEHVEEGAALVGALEGLEACCSSWRHISNAGGPGEPGAGEADDSPEALAALGRRGGELARDLRFLLRAADSGYVYYIESRGRGVFLPASPIDV
jgi:ATP-dependent DNA helicase DinG